MLIDTTILQASSCDTENLSLMSERQSNEALTTDKHFVQEGFEPLLDPYAPAL
jgi:hypothetical protein